MNLEPFGGRDVTECAVRIVNTGDGLSESLDTAPVELDHGATVHIVLRGTVTRVAYEQLKDSDELRRVHTVRANFGTLIEGAAARKILDTARRTIDDARGVQHLPGTADDD
jgi:hypothetical protein